MRDDRPTTDPLVQPPTARRGPGRRACCGGLASLIAVARAHAATPNAAAPPPEPFPDRVRLLVAGPRGGRMDRWAGAIGLALSHALPPGTTLHPTLAGGADGVTAANQFEARVAPDGQTVLLLPGEAPLAWLTGDPRARFDAASWLPVLTGLTPGVLASRVPLGALRPGSRLRVAASDPAGPELAALLGLELMGVAPAPAFGLHDSAAALKALRNDVVEAVFVTGSDARARLAEAASAGAAPLFTLGVPAESGMRRDPLLPAIPTAPELAAGLRDALPAGTQTTDALAAAWRSAAAATQIEFAMVLPRLTPAALVAQWRRAGAEASQALRPRAPSVRLLCALEANAATAAVAAGPAAMLELRRWLAERFNWSPS
jgi:hypothetical protein